MKILYFASLKQAVNKPFEEMTINTKMNVRELRALLVEQYGTKCFPENILCAVNQEIANETPQIQNSDEVAFYPPVTGG